MLASNSASTRGSWVPSILVNEISVVVVVEVTVVGFSTIAFLDFMGLNVYRSKPVKYQFL